MSNKELLPTRKPHRLPAAIYLYTGHEFHFTVSALHHRRPFEDAAMAEMVIDSLLWTRKKYDWVLFCYCLMPDHLHFVYRLTEKDAPLLNAGNRGQITEGVLEQLARFKSFTTTQSWKLGFAGKLWQRSSYDRVLDLDRPFQEVVQYVLENPVRKRWVSRWQDWPYSGIVDRWD